MNVPMCGISPDSDRLDPPLLPGERLDDLQCGGYRLKKSGDAFSLGKD